MAGIFGNLYQVLKAIPIGKRVSFAVALCVVAGGFIALLLWTNRTDYQVLFSNLDTRDASRITERLNEKRIPFQLKDGGRAVLVPDDSVYQLRLELASEGIPSGPGVGFEIFDDISFGTTEFVQKLKYQQALEGELARTIMQFDAIDQARVHIVTVAESLFVEQEKLATASVVIRPNPGRTVDQRQLQGIINLVACAVKDLKPENITVVDMAGGILSKGNNDGIIGDLSGTQFDYQRKLEETYEKRIRTMMEPVVGMNKVVARVSVEVDFRQMNISEERFDPDSVVVRSEQRQKETSNSNRDISSGSPDLKFQIYQSQDAQATPSARTFEKENSVINYEMNKVNTQIVNSAGEIKRLSAAVIIDGPYMNEKDAKGNTSPKFTPRSRKEMKEFEDIIKSAVGYNQLRGDQISVSNIAFNIQEETVPETQEKQDWLTYAGRGMKPLLNVILVALFFLLAIRPFKRWLSQTGEYVGTITQQQGESAPALESPPSEIIKRRNSKQQLLEETKDSPDLAADIIKTWINEVR
ncbi:MAG: flagellar M-ring protein FliF [Deltaproteobacteria bacterium]|nr:flagellar M-ring protein FliF [Deltaproteobacteria bacterium]